MTSQNPVLISIGICTYHRPEMLKTCLNSMLIQHFDHATEVNVIDNDYNGSAREIVAGLSPLFEKKGIQLNYSIEPQQGLSYARNRVIYQSSGDYLVFIDDDEYASHTWLSSLYNTLIEVNADGVWGPVLPEFEEGFPDWQKVFFEGRQMPTGTSLSNKHLNSGNLIIKKTLLETRKGPFDISLNQIGSEDTELFNYLSRAGYKFVWDNEAVVYESTPLIRTKLKWHLRRAYRGGWGFSLINHKNLGYLKAFFFALIWVLPASILHFFRAFKYGNIKTIFLAWMKVFVSQSGKIGYFLNIKTREYKKKETDSLLH